VVLQFDWETAIIARNETEKARNQCLISFNNFQDREKKDFWWERVLKLSAELIEINREIEEIEAAETNRPPRHAFNG
jgi:hypothetical protein